jgi:mannosyltransferase OCH1-like enzyme
MASTPQHPFFKKITIDLLTYVPKSKTYNQFILETTGPFMLNRLYDACEDTDQISLIASKHLFPLNHDEAQRYMRQAQISDIQQKLQSA